MLNNISSQNVYQKQYQLKNNLKTNTNFTNFENSQDKISFKGGNITKIAKNNKSDILIFSILGGFLTSLATKFGLKEKTESIDDKIARYAEKYPKLADILNQTYEIDSYSTQEQSVYDEYAKLAIYETSEKDPEKALILLKKLERNYNHEEYTEEVLNAVINGEITGNSCLTQEYNKKLLLKKCPELKNFDTYQLSADNLKTCIQYMTDEKNIEALQKYFEKNNKDSNFYINKKYLSSKEIYTKTLNNKKAMNLMLDIAKKYPDMSKESFNLITTLTVIEKPEDISSNIDKIIDFSNKSIYLDMTKNKISRDASNLLKYAKYYNKSNECCNLTLRLLNSHKFTSSHKDETFDSLFDKLEKTQKIFNSAFLEKDNKRLPFNDLFDKANDLNTDINLNLVNKLLKFADSINEKSEKHYKRMVNDGRYETLEKMQDLLPLYEKYPNTVITSDMVAKFNDPNRRALNLY